MVNFNILVEYVKEKFPGIEVGLFANNAYFYYPPTNLISTIEDLYEDNKIKLIIKYSQYLSIQQLLEACFIMNIDPLTEDDIMAIEFTRDLEYELQRLLKIK